MKEGWEVKRLGDICSLKYGKPLEKIDRYEDGIYPAYGANGIFTRTNKFYYNKPSIIIGRKGTAGALTLTEEKFFPLDVTYFVVFDDNKYNRKFLFYLLQTKNLPALAKGVKPGINRNDVYSLPICIPNTLPEQQRIVEILDDAFAKIDTVKQNAERNLKNVEELFHITLSKFYNIKNGRISKKLGDISSINYGYTAKSSPIQGEYKYLRITDIQNNHVEWDSVPFCKCEKEDAKKYILQNGDIVFARTGATTGKSFLLKGNFPKSLFASYLIRLKINDKNNLMPDFIRYYFDTSEYWETINRGIVGAAQGGFNASKLSEMLIYIPSLEEQQQIVSKLNALSEKCKELENNYQQTIHDCDELKKAILAKAFNGEL